MLSAIRLATFLIVAAAFSAPASAKTCKAAVSGKGLSTATAAADKREARARAGAVAKWRKAAHAKYGLAYRFWSRADARKVDCRKGKEVTRCTVTAKPCRVL